MKSVFEKIKERLEEEVKYQNEKAETSPPFCKLTFEEARRKMAECYEHAIEIVNQVAEEVVVAENATTNGGWIPCSERLPDKRDWYLAVFKEPVTGFIGLPYIADYLLGQRTNYTTKEGWIIKDCTDVEGACGYFKTLECVAWQPLPEPYKPEGE